MNEAVRRADEFTIKALLLSMLASAAAGVLMSFLLVPRGASASMFQIGAFGAVGGLLIGLPFIYVERLFGVLIDAISDQRLRIASRAIAYTLAALIGFGLGFPVAGLVVFGAVVTLPFGGGLLVSALVAVGAAFAIYGYNLLRGRLERSLVRIKEQEFAEKELELARKIQQRLLPPPEIEGNGYTLVARNLAATWVAGDFYDVFHLEDGTLGIAVADVAGKGMGASLIMSTAKAMLPLVASKQPVDETLREMNVRLRKDLDRREFVALAYARFDPASGRVELGNAGLPNPLLISDGGIREIDLSGPRVPLGIMKNVPYESVQISMKRGDRLLIFSDGLPEAPTGDGEQLGYEKLHAMIGSLPASPAAGWIDSLLEAIMAATNGPDDDCTVFLLERT